MSQNDTLVGWTPESAGRGTWSTIWSCLTIILLSLWVSHHGPATWGSNDGHGKSMPRFTRVLHFILALLLPERIVLMAAWDLREALVFRKEMRIIHENFSLPEAFYTCMGGYRAVIPEAYRKSENHPYYLLQGKTNLLLPSQILWLCKNGLVRFSKNIGQDDIVGDGTSLIETPDTSNGSATSNASNTEVTQTEHLKTQTLPSSSVTPQKENLSDSVSRSKPDSIKKQPNIAERSVSILQDKSEDKEANTIPLEKHESSVHLENRATIKGRSKSDSLAKAVVLFQASWFIVKCATRAAHNLPLALLEVLTLSYIACTFFAYGLWWFKPQNIEECTILDLQLSEQSWKALDLVRPVESYELSMHQFWDLEKQSPEVDSCWRDGWFGGDSFVSASITDENFQVINRFILLIALISGGLQLLAWNANFPTEAECYIWRVSSILIMVLPVFVICDGRVLWFSDKHSFSHKYRITVHRSATITMFVAKLMALILALMSFRAVPAATYDTWEVSNYLLQWL